MVTHYIIADRNARGYSPIIGLRKNRRWVTNWRHRFGNNIAWSVSENGAKAIKEILKNGSITVNDAFSLRYL